jgi:cell division protein FtsW (lipid II flippase)
VILRIKKRHLISLGLVAIVALSVIGIVTRNWRWFLPIAVFALVPALFLAKEWCRYWMHAIRQKRRAKRREEELGRRDDEHARFVDFAGMPGITRVEGPTQ